MKICSLYGAGFYYMPGTDICIKIGGYVRGQYFYNSGTNPTQGPFEGLAGYQTRLNGQANDWGMRARATVTVDTRQQTEYGTLRTYTLIGFNHDGGANASGTGVSQGPGNGLYATRAFIQLAGFTVGKAQSFYDIWSSPAVSYYGTASSDTGDAGMLLAAYTAQFGNGFTGTVSLEDPRRSAVVNAQTSLWAANGVYMGQGTGGFNANNTSAGYSANNPWTLGGPVSENGNVRWPDVVGVLRVDQAWGSAQIMAAIHDASGGYWGNSVNGSQVFGHPSDKIGWVIGGGAIINTDFISRGDKFQFQVNYTEGAVRYLDFTPGAGGSPFAFGSGNSLGTGWYSDGVYADFQSVQLTKGLGINASYDHLWNNRWKTSVYGGYIDISYNSTAKAMISASTCVAMPTSGGAPAAPSMASGTLSAMSNCNPDWSQWFIGTRTQFNINSSTYMGLDVMYRKLNTAFAGTAHYRALPGTARPSSTATGAFVPYAIEDQDAVSVTFRVHRDFLP